MTGTLRLIAVALVVALVTAGSSTAAFIVTSRNIKNGTIQLVDISPSARAALRGQRGPRGDAGAPGERGPAGFSSVTQVSNLVSVPVHTDVSVSVPCPTGTKVVGGGFHSASYEVLVHWSKPASTGQGWEAIGYNSGSTFAWPLGVYALCVSAN